MPQTGQRDIAHLKAQDINWAELAGQRWSVLGGTAQQALKIVLGSTCLMVYSSHPFVILIIAIIMLFLSQLTGFTFSPQLSSLCHPENGEGEGVSWVVPGLNHNTTK